jgi:hypothetical protein
MKSGIKAFYLVVPLYVIPMYETPVLKLTSVSVHYLYRPSSICSFFTHVLDILIFWVVGDDTSSII